MELLFIRRFVDIFLQNKNEIDTKKTCPQRAYWRDSDSKPAETVVQIWKLLPRPNLCEAATSQSRWDVICHPEEAPRKTD